MSLTRRSSITGLTFALRRGRPIPPRAPRSSPRPPPTRNPYHHSHSIILLSNPPSSLVRLELSPRRLRRANPSRRYRVPYPLSTTLVQPSDRFHPIKSRPGAWASRTRRTLFWMCFCASLEEAGAASLTRARCVEFFGTEFVVNNTCHQFQTLEVWHSRSPTERVNANRRTPRRLAFDTPFGPYTASTEVS